MPFGQWHEQEVAVRGVRTVTEGWRPLIARVRFFGWVPLALFVALVAYVWNLGGSEPAGQVDPAQHQKVAT